MDHNTFHVEEVTEAGRIVVRVKGVIDEYADVSFLGKLHGDVVLDLGGLRRINSFGVRTWMAGISSVPADATIELLRCPPPFVDQINMLKGFLGRARVKSFLATYECEACDLESDEPVDANDCRLGGYSLAPTIPCEECGGEMELNQFESTYLRFLRESA